MKKIVLYSRLETGIQNQDHLTSSKFATVNLIDPSELQPISEKELTLRDRDHMAGTF